MVVKNKKPEIRFVGFTDTWEQCKFNDVSDIVRGASPRPIKDTKWFDDESEVGWLRISDVTEQDGRIHYLKQRISDAGQEKTRVLNEPHLLLSIAATVGKPVINYVKTGVHDGFLIFLNPEFDHEFMFQWLEMFRPEWQRYGQPGSQVNLNSELVKNKEIMLPNRDEQTKIGDFFKSIDNLITLHQRKYDKLVIVKKSMLEKMFPKEGSNIPEIHFGGFTDAWEQRKLGEISNSFSGGTPSVGNDNFYGGSIPFIRSGEIQSEKTELFITDLAMKNSSAKLVEQGDILYALYGATSGEVGISRIDGAINQAILAIKPLKEYNSYFISQWLRKEKANIVNTYLQGGQGNLSGNIVKELNIKIPQDCNEQKRIGELFENVDNLITLHQRELEKLNNIKKSCLEKMFI